MKTLNKVKYLSACLVLILGVCGCSNNVKFDYVPPLKIDFNTSDNVVQIAEGETTYTITGKVTSSTGIMEYAAFNADARTGNITTEIPGTRVTFDSEVKREYSFSITVDEIESNRAVKIFAIDESGAYTKGFVIKITPTVIFTDKKLIESGDHYYGSFFATWHLGRVYPLRVAKEYPQAVDISVADFKDPLTEVRAPVLMSPGKRAEYGMAIYSGARNTKFSTTDITIDEYNAIKEVDDTPLRSLEATEDYVVIGVDKVYAYQTQDGRKGLIAIHSASKGDEVYTFSISAKVQK